MESQAIASAAKVEGQALDLSLVETGVCRMKDYLALMPAFIIGILLIASIVQIFGLGA